MAINLTKPTIGSTDWGTDVNNNWQEIMDKAVEGPSSATGNAIVSFDGSTGKLVQESLLADGVTAGALTLAKDGTTARTWTYPDASDKVVGEGAAQTLANKTLTSPVLNTGISGTAFLDEDDMASNSATKVASQQSIKAYVDSSVNNLGTMASQDAGTVAITGGSITGMSTPTQDSDVATKAYVDANAGADMHNDLTGLQGGITSEYYHLTSAQHSGLTGLSTQYAIPVVGSASGVLAESDWSISNGSMSRSGTVAIFSMNDSVIIGAGGMPQITLNTLGTFQLSGRTLVNVGTTSAPGYGFNTDTDTGIYGPSANCLGLVTGGSERMRIGSGGEVYIGTTSSLTGFDLLAVNGNAAVNGKVYLGTNGNQYIEGGALAQNYMTFSTGSSERMRIGSGGAVYIGTTSSLTGGFELLAVNGCLAVDDKIYLRNSTDTYISGGVFQSEIYFATGSTQAMKIDSSQKVTMTGDLTVEGSSVIMDLPENDPNVAGALYKDGGGYVMISAG